MLLQRAGLVAAVCSALSLGACDGDDGETTTGPPGEGGGVGAATVLITGTVVDFQTAQPISGSATLSLNGLNQPQPPTISVMGSHFEVSGIAPFSAFYLLTGAPPDYRDTFNVLTEVQDQAVTGVEAFVVAEAYLGELSTGFAVTPQANGGIVIARVLDEAGMPRAGVPGSAFAINDAPPPTGPFFLDETLAADAGLNETSSSGYAVFYDVPPGHVVIGAAMGSGFTISAPSSPVAVAKVTVVELEVSDGELMIPTNVSFATDVVPIFEKRGCTACHSGSSIGADLGDLALNGGNNKIYTELTNEISPKHMVTRVNLEMPEESLVLMMPSFEDPPDAHPNVTFAGPTDADYLTLLGWIIEGAKNN